MKQAVLILMLLNAILVGIKANPTWNKEEEAGLIISPSTCEVERGIRTPCGWGGIGEKDCKSYVGCCWDASDPQSKCYQRASCGLHPNARHECGWLGINNETCVRRGCCWDDTVPDAKFCYVKTNTHLPYGLCPVAPSERQECGYYGITKAECLGNACCWDPTVHGAKWCFHQPDEKPADCLVYGIHRGKCKYVCENGKKKYYVALECRGRACCY